MKIAIITQVRLSSTRLPEKILKNLGGIPALEIHLTRLKKCQKANDIIVATTNEENIDRITNLCKKNEVNFYQGSLTDVLDRYYQTAKTFKADIIEKLEFSLYES
jgi:spore coat polysaccharide biosynthesis protein SpsF